MTRARHLAGYLGAAPILLCGMATVTLPASGQLSLSTAINLTLQNSPKVKMAQADVDKARAALSESKDAFIPAVAATGGVGKSTGAPLAPPVVFSLGAQSLVYNTSQSDYIRAARAGLQSAQLALDAVRSDAAEDTTSSFVGLDNALQRRAVQADALGYARRLVTVTEERYANGVDPHIEVTKARHTEAQIRLQQLVLDDEIASQTDHLARLTGLPRQGLTTDHSSVPALHLPEASTAPDPTDPNHVVGLSAAFAAAEAKRFTAHGEKHYLLRPQIAFSANYSRISTAFNTYSQYYPAFGNPGNSFNSLSFGVEFTVPILDMVHRAKAQEAAADAAHSLYEAQSQQMLFLEGRVKLRHSAAELAARQELASLDRDLAQDQLDAVLVRLQAVAGTAGGEQLSPKDEQNARLQERLRRLDMLSAELQLEQVEVSLLRQEGSLTQWLAGTVPATSAAPANASPTITAPLAPTVGTPSPAGSAPGIPSTVPTEGTAPSSLPGSPVTNPTPGNQPGTPHP